MLVFGTGFGRTGTMSLRAALDELGVGPCHHGLDLPGQRAQIRAWLQASCDPDHVDWPRIFDGYNSAVDWPTAAFWRPLSEFYPEAKFVLSVRDENSWYDSMAQTVFKPVLRVPARLRGPVGRFVVATSGWLPPLPAMMQRIVYDGVFDGRLDRDSAIATFRRHVAEVTETLPAERVLVWKPADGWPALCAFLGKPVPDHPFPHLNDASAFRDRLRGVIAYFLKMPVAAAGRAVGTARRAIAARLAPGAPLPDPSDDLAVRRSRPARQTTS